MRPIPSPWKVVQDQAHEQIATLAREYFAIEIERVVYRVGSITEQSSE
jgi:hypothetical protein